MIRTRKEQWIAASSLPVELEESHFSSLEDMPDGDAEDDGDIGSSKGIMKRSRSFENLRTSERKVKFDEQPASSLSASPDDVSEEVRPSFGFFPYILSYLFFLHIKSY